MFIYVCIYIHFFYYIDYLFIDCLLMRDLYKQLKTMHLFSLFHELWIERTIKQ